MDVGLRGAGWEKDGVGGHSSNQVPEFCSRDCDTASVAGFLHKQKGLFIIYSHNYSYNQQARCESLRKEFGTYAFENV